MDKAQKGMIVMDKYDCQEDNNCVYSKARDFICMKHWDIKLPDLDSWLSNFPEAEGQYFAHRLIDNFIFYTEDQINTLCRRLLRLFERQLFIQIYQRQGYVSEEDMLTHLADVKSKSIYSYITGERPNPTDSGYLMCRYYRGIGIPEARIVDPAKVLQILKSVNIKYVFFFDDLIGSGAQTEGFWKEDRYGLTFEMLAHSMPDTKFYYLVLVATTQGLERVKRNCVGLDVIAAEVLGEEQSAFSSRSTIWANSEELEAFIKYYENICKKTGIDQDPDCKKGFGGLGLSIAFAHGIPDNSLPIYWWSKNGWHYLIRRDS